MAPKIRGDHMPVPGSGAGAGERQRREWRGFGKALAAAPIAVVILEVCVAIAGGIQDNPLALAAATATLGVLPAIWSLTGPVGEHLRGSRTSGRSDRVPAPH